MTTQCISIPPGTKMLTMGSLQFSFTELIDYTDRFYGVRLLAGATATTGLPFNVVADGIQINKFWTLIINRMVIDPEEAVIDLRCGDQVRRLTGPWEHQLASPLVVRPLETLSCARVAESVRHIDSVVLSGVFVLGYKEIRHGKVASAI